MDRFIEALRQIEGAYSLVVLTNRKLIGARDPLGIRPWSSASSKANIFSHRKPARWIFWARVSCAMWRMARSS